MVLTEEGFLLEHYIASKGITLLHGKFSTYKTPLTVHIAKAICTGEELWGLKVEKAAPVLYLEADTPLSVILPRLQAINVDVPGLDFAFCYPGFDIVNPGSSEKGRSIYQELWTTHREKQYRMVVIDSLRCIHRMKSVEDDTPPTVYGAISTLFEGATITIIHHDKKTKLLDRGQHATEHDLQELSAEAFSGSQAWINHATIGIHIKSFGDENVSLIHTKSQAGEKQPPLILNMIDGGTIVELPVVTGNDEVLLNIVKKLVNLGTKLTQIDKEIAKHLGVSVRSARKKRLELLEPIPSPDLRPN